MTIEVTPASAITLAGLIAAVLGWLIFNSFRIGQLVGEHNRTKEFVDQIQRTLVENFLLDARRRGVVQAQSPLHPNPEVTAAFGGLGDAMKKYYGENGLTTKSDDVVIWALDREFHDELIARVCVPLGINLGDALASALYLCRGTRDA